MYHTEAHVIIDQPITVVFATVSDIGRLKEWQDGLIEAKWTSKEPHGLGSTYIFISQFAGTRITMFSDSEPTGWMNLMRPLLKWMGERSYKRSLTRLKGILEA